MVSVLVAEDDAAERDLITFRLEGAGFAVRSCAAGLPVLDALGSDFAALVIEQRLPGLDGLELCRLIRANPSTADLPVLMVSDVETEEETLAAFAAGADDWLAEPAGIHDLCTRLNALLERCRRHPGHFHQGTPHQYRPRHADFAEPAGSVTAGGAAGH